MEFELKKSKNTIILTFSGELTISSAEKFRDALIQALDSKYNVLLNFENVTEIDLSCLQLLCSAHRTAGVMKKELAVAGPFPEYFKTTAASAGYLRKTGCSLDAHASCLWKV